MFSNWQFGGYFPKRKHGKTPKEFHEEGPVSCISKVSPQLCHFQPCFLSKKSLAAVGFGIMPWMMWMVISLLLGVNDVNAGIGLMMVG